MFYKKAVKKLANSQKTPLLLPSFNSEYCDILKSTYFEEHLRKAASENVKLKKNKVVHKEFLTLYERNK